MARIPTGVTKGQFTRYIKPHLSTAQRGYESDMPLYKIFNLILYKLYTSCPWPALPIEKDEHGQPVMSYQVPYYHFRKWSKDGSLQRLFAAGIISIRGELHLSELNLDGSHSAAKKGRKHRLSRPQESQNQQYPTSNRQERRDYCHDRHHCWTT